MRRLLPSFVLALMLAGSPALASPLTDRVEKRYNGTCFSADFRQRTTLEALDITSEARGKVSLAPGGRMRWEYRTPDPQLFVTDGTKVWVHLPADRQVQVGDARTTFGNRQSLTLLSDFGNLTRLFTVMTPLPQTGETAVLELVPKDATDPSLMPARLEVVIETGRIVSLETRNPVGDTTRIVFANEVTHSSCPDALFIFVPPRGVDILELAPFGEIQ